MTPARNTDLDQKIAVVVQKLVRRAIAHQVLRQADLTVTGVIVRDHRLAAEIVRKKIVDRKAKVAPSVAKPLSRLKRKRSSKPNRLWKRPQK